MGYVLEVSSLLLGYRLIIRLWISGLGLDMLYCDVGIA